jgi:hypothetical protein
MSIALYREFRQVRKDQPFSGQYMPYDWGLLPNRLGAQWMAYSMMFKEFSREISNEINGFTNNIESLAAWAVVTSSFSDRRKMDVNIEFVNNLATITAITPYVVRSRFIFATAHLCHQANMTKISGWEDDLPLDDEIYLGTCDSYGRHWEEYRKLKLRLEAIAGKGYCEETHNFRHCYNHRFSVNFMVGLTGAVTRNIGKKTGLVSYGFGSVPPIQLDELTQLLISERDKCYLAFAAFQTLVRAHEQSIAPPLTQPPSPANGAPSRGWSVILRFTRENSK